MIRTIDAAAEWIDEVGIALVFPKADVVIPSLWEQVHGSPEQDWVVRDADGTFLHWSDELAFLWDVDKAIASLHRRAVVTNSHLVEQDGAWGAIAHDLVSRKWRLPACLPDRTEARLTLTRLMLEQAGELTAADLGGPFGWRRRTAADLLDEVATSREEDGFRIWGRN